MRSLALVGLAALFLGGCAGNSVSESQCAVGDWETIGYRDGVNGQRSTRLLAHQDACMKHGFSPDREEYMLGWEQGVREYCDPNNGFHIGSRGGNHANVCPSDLKAGFLTAYRDGKTLYDARLAVANLEWEIDQKTNRLAEVKSQIVSVAAAQLSTELTAADRIELGDQLRRLYEEQELLKDEIPELEARLADKSRELDALNRAMASLTPVVGSVP